MNKRLLPLFYLRQRRKRKQRYRKKYWIRDIFRSRFLLGEYPTLEKEMHENDHESFYKYFRMTPERFEFVDKTDDRAQHCTHVARDVM